MAEIPSNVKRLVQLGIEPKVRELAEYRIPIETVLLASIAISLRKLTKDHEE